MKKLLFALALAALPHAARAQTTTNVTYRIQVETVTGAVTNTVSTNWRFDAGGTKKEIARLDGIQYAYANYVTAQGTNTVLALGPWLKQQHTALIDDYSSQKQAVDNAALAATINLILTTQSDLLSVAQKNQLIAIAALLP